MASISKRNGKYAVTYYEGDDRHPVMKSGLTASQAEKLRDKKNAEEKNKLLKTAIAKIEYLKENPQTPDDFELTIYPLF